MQQWQHYKEKNIMTKYKFMALFGEKEGIFKEIYYVPDPQDPDKPLVFDSEEDALIYRRGYKKWHIVPYDESTTNL